MRIIQDSIQVLLVLEYLPVNITDFFACKDNPIYVENLLNAFNRAGINITSLQEIVNKGFYTTTAIKSKEVTYPIEKSLIEKDSFQLEKEISKFHNLKAILLMGDTAIKSFYYISKRITGKRAITSGSTYKIRDGEYYLNGVRLFPSYSPIGKNFLIEKAKQGMVIEDIKTAYAYIK